MGLRKRSAPGAELSPSERLAALRAELVALPGEQSAAIEAGDEVALAGLMARELILAREIEDAEAVAVAARAGERTAEMVALDARREELRAEVADLMLLREVIERAERRVQDGIASCDAMLNRLAAAA